MTRDHASVAKLPDAPGVYYFVGPKREVLYVGKATSLRDRVKSYFAGDLATTRGSHMVTMVARARRIDYRETDSVLEALILEARLIKELKPQYNTRDKDDKSFNHVVMTTHEEYPRLLTVRGNDLVRTLHELGGFSNAKAETATLPVYGPFPHAGQLKEALKLIRKIFPYYDTKRPVTELMDGRDRKLRFNQSIGVYPKEGVSPRDYAKTIRHIRLFFAGKKRQVIQSLTRDMHAHAAKREFEEAARCKRQVFALQHIEDVSLIRRSFSRERPLSGARSLRVEGYDVAHLAGDDMVGVMSVVIDGEVLKREYRTFNVMSVAKSNDTQALREVLTRRLEHTEWEYPRLVVVDGGAAQRNVAKKVLADAGIEVPVVAVTKDEKHRPKRLQGQAAVRRAHMEDILLANAEAHRFSLAMHTRKRRKRMRA